MDINDQPETNSIKVSYMEKNEFGKFKEVYESFELHEDGDPRFILESAKYKKMIHSDVEKEMWKVLTTEGMKRHIMRTPGQNIWFVDESTGNEHKYIMPKK